MELNASFYSWPTIATVAMWQRQASSKNFIYTVKVCELIIHTKLFTGTKILVQDFGFIADLLQTHMGCFLYQLPPSFHYTPARLRNIVSQLDPRCRNVDCEGYSITNAKALIEILKNHLLSKKISIS